ncbi:MAG: glycosyltransferase [Cyclobacteriaceae bacterium]|nr:glycosyltransferase [Cyclobacteriaceae bacterium]
MGKIKLLFMIESMKAGGAERQLHELMTGLSPQEFEVKLITWVDNPPFFDSEPPYLWKCYPRRSKFDFKAIITAAQLLKKGQADMVHGFLDTGNFYAAMARQLAGKGVIIASERSSKRKLSLLQRWHKPWAHRRASLTICNSLEGQKFIQTMGVPESHTMVIVNGINTQLFHPKAAQEIPDLKESLGLKADRRYLISVGRIAPVKNQLETIKAFAASNVKEGYDLLLVGASQRDYEILINQEVENLGLHSQVKIIPPVKNIQEYYQVCDVLVLFSLREGTPNALLEAMACGLPCVVSDVGDCPKYVQPRVSGWVVPSRAIDRLSKAFDEIAKTDPTQLRTMGASAKQSLIDLMMDKSSMIQKFTRAYKSLHRQTTP